MTRANWLSHLCLTVLLALAACAAWWAVMGK